MLRVFDRAWGALALVVIMSAMGSWASQMDGFPNTHQGAWVPVVHAWREAALKAGLNADARAERQIDLWRDLERDYPMQWDWIFQDCGPAFAQWFTEGKNVSLVRDMIQRALVQFKTTPTELNREYVQLCRDNPPVSHTNWLCFYSRVCEQRRAERLQLLAEKVPSFVYTRHSTIRPSFFAYTEGQSDAQAERHFLPGATLMQWSLDGINGKITPLIDDPKGAIRDPAVSLDGERVVFAWKKSLDQDDYHLYELTPKTGKLRQLTEGRGFADYEPSFLPNGDLIFSSTRCVQTVDCWWTEVSNLYTCDPNGRYLRRLTVDQVHSVFPTVLDDGRVIYTRWDYNDRGQVFPQPLFQMNADGTGQQEFYGSSSWFPTTITHARGIPGTQKVMGIFCGHHSSQAGKLGVLDPSKGRQENSGAMLVAPVRETPAERIDSYGQEGELFQYPFPISESEFLVTYAPMGWEHQGRANRRKGDAHFGIYWMNLDGTRELLAMDAELPCQQAVVLARREPITPRPNLVDYRRQDGTYYIQDVYAGAGLAGIARGTIKSVRVVALEFRPAGIGNNSSGGPGGGAMISTPVAVGNGTWDVKKVLGDARVYEDGSAFFVAPARTPVYFQALDEEGQTVQTMRTWSTLQPGENASCVGCHENRNTTPVPPRSRATLALQAGPKPLVTFHGAVRGFSFQKEVQPILDRNCITCHKDRNAHMRVVRAEDLQLRLPDPKWIVARPGSHATNDMVISVPAGKVAFSLLAEGNRDVQAKRVWSDSYLNLVQAIADRKEWDKGGFRGLYDGKIVNWIGTQSVPSLLPPYSGGSARSQLMTMLKRGHAGTHLSREDLETIACWIDLYVPFCGDYVEANAWTDAEKAKYQRYADKRAAMEQLESQNIQDWLSRSKE